MAQQKKKGGALPWKQVFEAIEVRHRVIDQFIEQTYPLDLEYLIGRANDVLRSGRSRIGRPPGVPVNGPHLLALRRAAGLSQAALAYDAGKIDPRVYRRYEKSGLANTAHLEKVARVLSDKLESKISSSTLWARREVILPTSDPKGAAILNPLEKAAALLPWQLQDLGASAPAVRKVTETFDALISAAHSYVDSVDPVAVKKLERNNLRNIVQGFLMQGPKKD